MQDLKLGLTLSQDYLLALYIQKAHKSFESKKKCVLYALTGKELF